MNFFNWSGDCSHVTNPAGSWNPHFGMFMLFAVPGQLCSELFQLCLHGSAVLWDASKQKNRLAEPMSKLA